LKPRLRPLTNDSRAFMYPRAFRTFPWHESFFWLPAVKRLALLLSFLVPICAHAALLPGFRMKQVAPVLVFLTSLVTDSHGTIYYTQKSGKIIRAGNSEPLAHV